MRINKKLKVLIVFCVIIGLVGGTTLILKNIFLGQVKKKIQSNFNYTRLYLSLFPPALVIEDARSVFPSPFFFAKKISLRISMRSLLSREKPLNVFIEEPVFRVDSFQSENDAERKKFNFSLPFAIDKGLIKNGELFYWGGETRIVSNNINALFTLKRNAFSLQGEVADCDLDLGYSRPRIKGRVDVIFEGDNEEINVKRLRMSGSYGVVKGQGKIFNTQDPEILLDVSYLVQAPLIAHMLELPFYWEGQTNGKGTLRRKKQRVAFNGSLSSKTLVLNDVPMGHVEGTIDFKEPSGGTVDVHIQQTGRPRQFLEIRFNDKGIEGIAQNVFLRPVANFLDLPWPVSSPASGNFSFKDRKLTARLDFKDELVKRDPSLFPFYGSVNLNWDGVDRVSFATEGLDTNFAKTTVKGEMTLEKHIDMTVEGDVKDVKEAREFTELILRKNFDIPEIRGKGYSKIRIFGDFDSPQVKANFSLSPAGFNAFGADSVTGEAELIQDSFFGRFDFSDPDMEGEISVVSTLEEAKAEIRVTQGSIETILPAIDVTLPIRGEASGDFTWVQRGENVQLNGSFSGEKAIIAGQKVFDVSGAVEWTPENLFFPNFRGRIHSGQVEGYALIKPSSRSFDVHLQASQIDLSSIYPGLEGVLLFTLEGKGFFGQDKISGPFEIQGLHFYPFQQTSASGKLQIGFSHDILDLDLEGNFHPGDNKFSVLLGIPLFNNSLASQIKGTFNNPDILMPWKGTKARLDYIGEIEGTWQAPQIKGAIEIQGSLLPFPAFAHAFRDFSALLFVENEHLSVRSFQGKFGGGDVTGSGSLKLGKTGMERIDINAEGKDLSLSLLERTTAQAEGQLNLIKDEDQFVLEGDFLIHRLFWKREIEEKFSFSSVPYPRDQREKGFFDDLSLNIRLKADDNVWIENSLGTMRARFDLTTTGNIHNPGLIGEIVALDGNVEFQDRTFKILEGRINFFNPVAIEPYIHFKGETYVKDYHVIFSLDGLPDRLNPEFNSSPPLPPEDVLALLALGEAFRRTYHYDRSKGQSTASLLSFQLTEEAEKRAGKIFGIDRFRIDPFVMGDSSEMTARLTLGEKISRNFFILYSTNLSSQREDITRIEWELTDDLSIVGVQNETGRISIDVKVHKRFK